MSGTSDDPGGRTDDRIFNVGFRLVGKEVDGWELVKTVSMGDEGETVYLLRRGDALARVAVAELPSQGAAEERVRLWLRYTMRGDLPDGRERFPEIGDTVFWSPDRGGVPSSMSFVRGNHAVGVARAEDVPFDVEEVAAQVDRLLVRPPDTDPQDVAVRRKRSVLVEGLDVERPRRLHFRAPDGEFARDADKVTFVRAGRGPSAVQIWSD